MSNDYTDYDAGLLNDYGGGNVDWWLDYLRAEIGRANDHWRGQAEQGCADFELLREEAAKAQRMCCQLADERDRYREMFSAAKKVICGAEAALLPGEWASLADAIAALKAELAKYTAPLTVDEIPLVNNEYRLMQGNDFCDAIVYDSAIFLVKASRDAAIREVRGKR